MTEQELQRKRWEQLIELANEGHKFTTEELSVEEAVSLFDELPGDKIFESTYLLDGVIPEEYLDNKEFMMSIIPKRKPFTYPSVLRYASPRLKNDREVVSFAIKHHGFHAVLALQSKIFAEDEDIVESAKNNPYLLVSDVTSSDWGDIYIVRSKILEDEEFVSAEIDKAVRRENDDLFIVDELMICSKVCSSTMDFASKAAARYPSSMKNASPELLQQKEFFIKALDAAIDNKLYLGFVGILKQLNIQEKHVPRVDRILSKLQHLPESSQIRKGMYEKALRRYVDKMLAPLPEKGQLLKVEENNIDTFDTIEDENE